MCIDGILASKHSQYGIGRCYTQAVQTAEILFDYSIQICRIIYESIQADCCLEFLVVDRNRIGSKRVENLTIRLRNDRVLPVNSELWSSVTMTVLGCSTARTSPEGLGLLPRKGPIPAGRCTYREVIIAAPDEMESTLLQPPPSRTVRRLFNR